MSGPIFQKDINMFNLARKLASYGEHRVRVGCVAVVKGKVVSMSANVVRNVSLVDYKDITVHAEMACLRMVSKRQLSDVTLYICRIDQDGRLKPSFPCARCMERLNEFGISKYVCYTIEPTSSFSGKLVKHKIGATK